MSTSKLEFKDSTYLDTAFPASKRIYVQGRIHPSVRVPLREISVKDGSRLRVYDTRGPWGDPAAGLRCAPWASARLGCHGFWTAAIPSNTKAGKCSRKTTVISASNTPLRAQGRGRLEVISGIEPEAKESRRRAAP